MIETINHRVGRRDEKEGGDGKGGYYGVKNKGKV